MTPGRAVHIGGVLACMVALAQGARAEPLLSIAGTMDSNDDYNVVLDALEDVGADATTLTLFWDLMEPDGIYAPEPDWPGIANQIYPQAGLQVTLTISVIDTVSDRRPVALRNLPFSDPEVIDRFESFLTRVLKDMPDVQLTSIGIGNEVDGFLNGDAYQDFALFLAAASDVAHDLAPGVPVGTVLTWDGLLRSADAQALAALGDVWMINHYPLNADFVARNPDAVGATLAQMVELATAPVYLTETGYPSAGCGASAIGQLTFVQNTLGYALAHSEDIPLVTLVWLHDLGTAEVAGLMDYYDQQDSCFADHLSSLGLRTSQGQDKPAFDWLRRRD